MKSVDRLYYESQSHPISGRHRAPAPAAITALAVLLAACGCQPDAEIESYNVPKELATPASPTPNAAPTDRMLAAVLPEQGRAWFFKLVGPTADVDRRADEVTKFFESVRRAADKPRPDWQLPEGWQEQPGSGMRAATIMVPGEGASLEMSVMALPWSDTHDELLANVNRWRDQLRLAPVDAVGLSESTREVQSDDATMTIVDLRGNMQSTDMTPPFANMTAPGASAMPPAAADAAALPAGHPPISGMPAATDANLTYDTPAGWQAQPASGMRKAAFGIARDGQQALVTVIDFPASAGPMLADPLANVNRWRGEVGLGPIAESELDDAIETIEVDGTPASYVEAVPDPAQPEQSQMDRATLAATVTHGDLIWFVKLTGDRDLVAQQRDEFRAFLASLTFTADQRSE